jgi:hypothetical protein
MIDALAPTGGWLTPRKIAEYVAEAQQQIRQLVSKECRPIGRFVYVHSFKPRKQRKMRLSLDTKRAIAQ